MKILKARKKPVEVECIKFNGRNVKDIASFIGKSIKPSLYSDSAYRAEKDAPVFTIEIKTLNGPVEVFPGEYIIKGVSGEFYPCSEEIFKKTYDIVE
jgi:hypothetical protein